MPHDVFISYSSKDKNVADAVCAVLERNGIRCWVAPRDVIPGIVWGTAIVGAIHFRGSPTSSDPGMLTKAYADLFTHKGGRFLKGDARHLAALPSGWSVVSEKGSIEAREAVVALGP